MQKRSRQRAAGGPDCMTIEVGLSNAAKADLVDIWQYSARQWNSRQADDDTDDILSALESLADNPHTGRDCSDLFAGARRLTCGRHVAFYGIRETHIEVVRILHQSLDLPSRRTEG